MMVGRGGIYGDLHGDGQSVAAAQGQVTSGNLEILKALHNQVERLGLNREPMSPIENHLANAILVLLNVLIDERKKDLEKLLSR